MLADLADSTLRALGRRDAGLGMAITGGGASALAALAGSAGASAVLIDGRLAYSRRAAARLRRFDHPDGYSSAAMAMDLAHAALDAAVELDDRRRRLRIGVGVASALATDPPRAGRDRAHLAVVGPGPAAGWRLALDGWPGDRAGQERLASAAALLAAWRGAGCGPDEPGWPDGLAGALRGERPDPDYWLRRVASGDFGWARCHPDLTWSARGAPPGAVLAGSFDPLHEGHLGLAAAAAEHLQTPVELELSLQNVDKGRLAAAAAAGRVAGVAGRAPMVIDRAATFVEKSALFPGAVFVIGADTAVRVVDPRYYGGGAAGLGEGLDRIRANGCSFLVAGRSVAGRYVGFDELDLGAAPDLFAGLPPAAFRRDVSSSQIRARRTAPAPE